MPALHPDNIIRPGEDDNVINLILQYHHVSSLRKVPRNSINISQIRFYNSDGNAENDYLVINFKRHKFYTWNKLSWFELFISFFYLKSFKIKRSEYDFLKRIYVEDENKQPDELHCIYCMGTIKPFVVFFFKLLDGPGTEGNSVGVKIPKGAA